MNPFSGKHVSGSAKRSERVEGSSSPRSERGHPGPSHPRGCPRGLGGLSRPVRARGPQSAALTEGRRARWPPQQSCGVRDTSAGVARMWGACGCTDVLDRLERERSDSRLRHGIPSREQASGGGGQGRRAGDGCGFGSGPRSKWRLHHLPAGRRSSSSSSPEPQFPHLRNVGRGPAASLLITRLHLLRFHGAHTAHVSGWQGAPTSTRCRAGPQRPRPRPD